MESNDFSTPKPLGKGHGAVIAVDTKKIRSIHSVQTVRADWTLPETSTLVEGLLAGVNKQSKADFILLDCTFEDNTLNVKTFTPGQSIHFLVDIVVRHTGRANVSVVDLKTQKMIGTPLFNWPVYADNNLGPADWVKNETDFTVVLPDLGAPCQQAGACAIQWWWYATSNKQTYQSCVDFGTP
ncbi:hypothetical protein NLJ89_g9915 [Agrocybe chaxingu]|uniref:Chitin-binding type-4 domain-containing protein n=1 Tax=Agrocybe chaxingu TaxID=84603 RepID=A0A9W8JRS7_9AGAR|nr:hypothetical protein NLJ89_g9915 [Agrocybe chaxingu]